MYLLFHYCQVGVAEWLFLRGSSHCLLAVTQSAPPHPFSWHSAESQRERSLKVQRTGTFHQRADETLGCWDKELHSTAIFQLVFNLSWQQWKFYAEQLNWCLYSFYTRGTLLRRSGSHWAGTCVDFRNANILCSILINIDMIDMSYCRKYGFHNLMFCYLEVIPPPRSALLGWFSYYGGLCSTVKSLSCWNNISSWFLVWDDAFFCMK